MGVTHKDSTILNGDSLNILKTFADDSADAIITDPPYGYSFMGKDWDKAVPSVDIWRECLRVLKPGGWCMVMSAPRSDVQNAMISRLMEAGFRLDFTPIYWTYASGFPKAGNVAKLAMKRVGDEGKVVGTRSVDIGMQGGSMHVGRSVNVVEQEVKRPTDPRVQALDGSYTGFQPKPAVEVVIVAMKPLSEKTYVDQALKNGKGITWLDDCRVPTDEVMKSQTTPDFRDVGRKVKELTGQDKLNYNSISNAARIEYTPNTAGRFPANLLVSDEALNSHSKFFDLDAWADTLPFLAVPKASKSEKNAGLDGFEEKFAPKGNNVGRDMDNPKNHMGGMQGSKAKNHHPTVKPLKLMSYLITLTTREGDVVVDPFVGSGTTAAAAKMLNRIGVGIEREPEYAEIAAARLFAAKPVQPEPEQMSITDLMTKEEPA